MDRSPKCVRSTCRRFPRPRGDGPCLVARSSRRPAVSPPTRGWTPYSVRLSAPTSGFPAHAGMDPCACTRHRRWRRFPRPRGDGPGYGAWSDTGTMVSPPTRGWTADRRPPAVARMGFPAHAGMDPFTWASAGGDSGFPRPRGDGPHVYIALHGIAEVSPPTRGWTPRGGAAPGRWRGFPAHAGMDPIRRARTSLFPRFPRPRGDGPQLPPGVLILTVVSPPTRGWTASPRMTRQERQGFPAHAGMDPLADRLSAR